MRKIVFLILAITFIGSITAQTKEEKKLSKKEKAQQEYELVKELINSKKYSIEATWATAHNGRRINLTTNANQLKIDNNEADIDLPFFGQGYSGSAGFGGDNSIKFQGTLQNYNVDFDDSKQRISVKFNGKSKNDSYNFTLSIFKSGNTSINVTSNNRSAMNYDGKVSKSKESE